MNLVTNLHCSKQCNVVLDSFTEHKQVLVRLKWKQVMSYSSLYHQPPHLSSSPVPDEEPQLAPLPQTIVTKHEIWSHSLQHFL